MFSEKDLLSDRARFKLHAAEYHLNQLKKIDNREGNILKDKVNAEIQIDCFFAQIIGAKDALLVQINEKEKLGLRLDKVNLRTLNSKLNTNKKKEILRELNDLSCDKKSWYWLLIELKNHSMHREMLSKDVSMSFFDKPHVAFLVNPLDKDRKPMGKSVIETLEESLQSMRELIDRIRKKAGIVT